VGDGAVVLQVTLPPGQVADVGVVNIFEQGDGEVIAFPTDGFDVTTAVVTGVECNFADFVALKGWTPGSRCRGLLRRHVNVSFQAVDPSGPRRPDLLAGVRRPGTYRHAARSGNYGAQLAAGCPGTGRAGMVFSCTCILNHFYAESANARPCTVFGS